MKRGSLCFCFCWDVVVVTWWLTCCLLLLCSSNELQPCPATSPPTSAVSPLLQWRNSYSAPRFHFQDKSSVMPILHTGIYGCGFYGNETIGDYFFAIYILDSKCYCYNNNNFNSSSSPSYGSCHPPQVVWSANRNSPVKINSAFEFDSNGYWVLKDADGKVAWYSFYTAGQSVVGMNLTELGNLVFINKKDRIVWQSFDYPTDSLVPGQTLKVGHKLSPSVSSTNLTSFDLFSLYMNQKTGLVAQLETDPPQVYYQTRSSSSSFSYSYIQFLNGSLTFFSNNNTEIEMDRIFLRKTTDAQYIKFGSDGHLRVYEFRDNLQWEEMEDLSLSLRACGYPTVCGEYGVCLSNGESCTCPIQINSTANYFKKKSQPEELGCSEITPLSCKDSKYQSFVELTDVTYRSDTESIQGISRQSCKEACASDCSCKAAFFYDPISIEQNTSCSLVKQVFSMMGGVVDWDAYIKVQNVPNPIIPRVRNHFPLKVILGASISSLVLVALLIFLIIWKKVVVDNDVERYYLNHFPGILTRFSYDELKAMTGDFSKKLGEGGFGSVFEGTLPDGKKIAVKCLDGLGPIKNSFFSEVKTIGAIHHVNLARLLGFCVEKSHRLLVYEYMANGSLERWIFNKIFTLKWQQRKKIILDVARGLNYLHLECRQKIIHLDIKPQNILLDEDFNAKVSDFGLSKLIDKDQSRIVITMRGTPGYLAPEWLSSVITEKVDVYSFGVVILEVVCGRKVFDASKDEEDRYLLNLIKRKDEEGRLLDMVSGYSKDMQLNGVEAVKMLKLSAWCLQADHTKRPSMLMIIKVLEGVINVKQDLDYNFWNHRAEADRDKDDVLGDTAPPLPSILSGPR